MTTLDELYQQKTQIENNITHIDSVIKAKPVSGNIVDGAIFWSEPTMLIISISVLLFGIIILILTAFLLYKNRNADLLLKSFGIPLIIISSVFLIVAGYTEKQIAPVIGLLGTIAGYLLGKSTVDPNLNTNEDLDTKINEIEKKLKIIDKNI